MQNILKQGVERAHTKGFLISCDKNRERQAVKDAYNFLTQYIDKQYHDLMEEYISKKISENGEEKSLETEIKYYKRRDYQVLLQVETNVQCMIYLKINPLYHQIDPNLIVHNIMQDVHKNNIQVTRYCHRVLPVESSFKAEHFKMLETIEELFRQRQIHNSKNQIKSWMLNFKCRNNNKFNYKEILKQTSKITAKYGHFVDIYYPQWTVSVEVVNHLMCVSISQEFKETNQFKLHKKQLKLKPRHLDQHEEEQEEHVDFYDELIKKKKQKQEESKLKYQGEKQKEVGYEQKIVKQDEVAQDNKELLASNKETTLHCERITDKGQKEQDIDLF